MPGADEVNKNLSDWSVRRLAGLQTLADVPIGKGILEAEAKMNAPWTDRTTLARKGLHGGAEFEGDELVIYIAHSMPYGVHLELSNAGKYAILKPTLERNLQRIQKVLKDYWEKP